MKKIINDMKMYDEPRKVNIKGYKYILYGMNVYADKEKLKVYVLVENIDGELDVINICLFDLKFIDNKLIENDDKLIDSEVS